MKPYLAWRSPGFYKWHDKNVKAAKSIQVQSSMTALMDAAMAAEEALQMGEVTIARFQLIAVKRHAVLIGKRIGDPFADELME